MPDTPPEAFGTLIARNLAGARGRAKLSQARVGERMRQLGFSSWRRQTMSMVENGGRNVAADEIVGLALALETTVPRLTSAPDDRGGQFIALPSGLVIPARRLTYDDLSLRWDGDVPVLAPPPSAEYAAELERHSLRIRQIQDSGGEYTEPRTGTPSPTTAGEPMTEPATTPEPQPVAAAIVTSSRGVLAGRRNDGKPPWTFIAGEVEPGETAPFAAVREVKEETGLEVRAGSEIGRRVHPKTGRTMIYVAAEPARPDDLDVFVGDTRELAEVRWLTLAEADELLPGMFEPVHEYLSQELAEERP
jgi:8-oxo-dGTP pyrophosphatase MutT (NUDIX family)/transcriptional regulator with XRE-family HTH domain